jgi:hypothetical protein
MRAAIEMAIDMAVKRHERASTKASIRSDQSS